MSTVRKRKMMIKKLHQYFKDQGKILSEREYMAVPQPPYRIYMIDKFLGGWPRMEAYLKHYFPEDWAHVEKVKKEPVKEAPKINLDVLADFNDD